MLVAVFVRRQLRRVLAIAVVVLTLHAQLVNAAPSRAPSYDDYAEHLEQAQARADAEDYGGALGNFAQAYAALPADDRVGELGADVIDRVIGLTAATLAEPDPDPEALRRARAVLVRHLGEVEQTDPQRDLSAVHEQREQIDAALAQREPAPPPPPPTANRRVVSPTPTDTSPSRRRLALGLTIGGSVAAVAGIGLIGYGGWFSSRNRDLQDRFDADDAAGRLTVNDRTTMRNYLDEEKREAATWIVAGVVATTAGVGVLTAGLIMLRRERRATPTTATVSPIVGPQTAGLLIRARF